MRNTKTARRLNQLTDLLMIVIMPMLMAYSLIGETFHEVIGTIILVLFLMHQAFHANWWKAIFKGRYTPHRCCVTVLNVALLILMVLQPLSGIVLSRHLFTFLPINGIDAQARAVHMAVAYWLYILMSVHVGLHLDRIGHSLRRKSGRRRRTVWIIRACAAGVSVYGIHAFVQRGLPGYMFLRTQFAFFDPEEPKYFFFIDYLAIFILFSFCGYCVGKTLKIRLQRKTRL
jgi:hypothetical protein